MAEVQVQTNPQANVAAPRAGAEQPDEQVLSARRIVFYSVFVFMILVYLVTVPAFYLPITRAMSLGTMQLIAAMSPILNSDLVLVGDLVPALLGAVIGSTAPKTANIRQLVTILVVASATYLLYVHMTWFFAMSDGKLTDRVLDAELLRNGIRPDALLTLANSSRNFTVFVISTIVGIRFNGTATVSIPMQAESSAKAKTTTQTTTEATDKKADLKTDQDELKLDTEQQLDLNIQVQNEMDQDGGESPRPTGLPNG